MKPAATILVLGSEVLSKARVCGRGLSPARRWTRRGFSLVEVIVAVGIFAIVIAGVIGLLGPSAKAIAENNDTIVAGNMADRIASELTRLRGAPSAFASFAAGIPSSTSGTPLKLVATRSGDRIVREADSDNDPLTGTPRGIVLADRYFLIEVRQQAAPLNYSAGDGVAAVAATVSWPYEIRTNTGDADATQSAAVDRSSITVNLAILPAP